MLAPNSYEGYRLLHEGVLALADAEEAGMMVDVEYVKQKKKHLTRVIAHAEKKIAKQPEILRWKKIYGKAFNIDSDQQMADVLFKHLGYEPQVFTNNDNPSVSQEALEQIDSPMVQEIIELRRLKKIKGTYLENYIRETVDSYLHPFFHLHIVQTFRSSSSRINFQNQPVRIPMVKKMVRQAVIPRPGRMLCEIDYSGVEVRIAACYHKDPAMIQEIIDPERDMHRDMAQECYLLDDEDLIDGSKRAKDIRYCGKNKFVFPQFYGDYYGNNAKDLWSAISTLKLKSKEGRDLKAHLKRHGIKSQEDFTNHLQQVEDFFWTEKFPVYAQWKEDHWKEYCRNGFVSLLSGFVCRGKMSKNEAINYPVQGAAFHCLLWSLVRLNRWLRENGYKTLIIGQVHDSIVLDMVPEEMNEVLAQAKKIMTEEIRAHWPWIIVPLEIEAEVTPVNGSWFLKKEVHESPCGCGAGWRYKNYFDDGLIWECPVCGEREEV